MSRSLKKIFLASLIVIAFLGLWTVWWEPSRLDVVRQTISVEPWHVEHTGLKIAVMSDLHVGSPHRDLPRLKALVTVTNAEKPDLVVILGDFVIQGVLGGNFVEPEPIADALAGLRAPLGVVAVLGNHDWWFNGERVRRGLESRGIRVLENENLQLTYRGKSFWLCGLADLATRGDQLLPTLNKIADSEPIVVLTHNPDIFPQMPDRVSLSLAGHTHGGQVNFPIVGRLVVPSKFGSRYAYGLIRESHKSFFVTAGVGTSILPVRFRVPPEIVILTLVGGTG